MGGKRREDRELAMAAPIAAVFRRFPNEAQTRLRELRKLIIETAAETPGVGVLTETLKWGEVSYLTEESKSGTTIRIAWRASQPENYAMFVSCNTSLVSEFRIALGSDLLFEGNRAVVMSLDEALPRAPLRHCIRAALTYFQRPE